MFRITFLAALLASATGLRVPLTPPARMQTLTPPARMQTLTPDAPTTTVPDALPTSWTVPDSFSMPEPKTEQPPFYRVTLFKHSDYDSKFAAQQLVKVVGLGDMRAEEVARQAAAMGFAVVGEWVQEIAEMHYEGLKAQTLTVDVSEVQ